MKKVSHCEFTKPIAQDSRGGKHSQSVDLVLVIYNNGLETMTISITECMFDDCVNGIAGILHGSVFRGDVSPNGAFAHV